MKEVEEAVPQQRAGAIVEASSKAFADQLQNDTTADRASGVNDCKKVSNLFGKQLIAEASVDRVKDISESKQPSDRQKDAIELAGEYHREEGAQKGNLDVKELNDSRIKFTLQAAWESPNNPDTHLEGKATGIIPVKDNVAVYTKGDLKLTFSFSKDACDVTCNTRDFGQVYVDPNGRYYK